MFTHGSSNTAANSPRGVYYARKAPGEDWEYPVKIPGSNAVSSNTILASDGSGAMALWITTVGSDYSLVASRYTKTKQFIAPVSINDPDLKGSVGLLWLGEEYAQLNEKFCEWKRSRAGECTKSEINRSAFVAWIDCAI